MRLRPPRETAAVGARLSAEVFAAARANDRVRPWDIIDGGMKTPFFQSEFRKALREEWTLPPKRQKENLKLLPVID